MKKTMNLKYVAFFLLWGSTLFLSVTGYANENTEIQKGAYLFKAAGGCSCHTNYEEGGAFLAGGRPLKTPFGIFYSTNITPDEKTGIGQWSNEDFIKAMTEGIGPGGIHYAPVFPYTSFTKITPTDLLHLKAYLSSVPAVEQKNKPHDLVFPFGQRLGFFLWQKMFFKPKPFQKEAQQSDQWNRGAYLAEALAHCGECHTPRNLLGVLEKGRYYAGSKDGPEGELAPNITPDESTGIGDWTQSDIADFLQSGFKLDGDDSQGVMGEVIEHGFQYLTQEDLEAIAAYVKSVPPIKNQLLEQEKYEEYEE